MKFEVEAPDGRILEIEGDTPPSGAELDKIFKSVSNQNTQQPQQIEQIEQQPQQKQGIDLTPSGIVNKIVDTTASAIETPVYMLKNKQGVGKAFKQASENVAKTRAEMRKQSPVLSGLTDFGTDLLGYSYLPTVGESAVGRGLTGLYQGGLIGGLESLKENQNPLSGVVSGGLIGAGLNSVLPPILNGVSNGVVKTIENPNVQNAVGKTIEVLTSVPEKFTKRALNKELSGNSILNSKFDAEKAYRPIEAELRNAKSMLPTQEDFATNFYNLGQKAKDGMESLKNELGAKLGEVLDRFNDKEASKNIQLAAKTIIDNFGKGGVYNSAREVAPRVVDFIENSLSKEGLTYRDLHRIKDDLYRIGYAASQNREGTAAEVARGVAEQINNYLRGVAPEYKKLNDTLSLLHTVENELGGIHSSTIGSKLSNYGDKNNLISGLDQKLKNIDTLLPQNSKFINDTKTLVNSQDKVNNINKLINAKYERNPRLLGNVNDTETEMALEDLQNMTGINFMDALENTRAQEALSRLFPGQGGGSGSSQGFGNLLRTAIIGGSPTAAFVTHNPLSLLGLGAVSPKMMGAGTIKNISKIYNGAKNLKEMPELVKRLLAPSAVKAIVPLFYGGVEYNDYQ